MTAESSGRRRAPLAVALAAVLLASIAQMAMQPATAPLVLELGLEPWHVGVAIAASAAMMLAAAPAWMRVVRRHGARGPIVAAMLLATTAMAIVAALVMLAPRVGFESWCVAVALIVLRGFALGACIAAIVPAARLVISTTQDDASRARGLAAIESVQGVSVVMGVALGGGLSSFGALVPIAVAPVLLGIAGFVAAIGIPRGIRAVPASAPPLGDPRSLVDARTWPFAAAVIAVTASVACVQLVLGFVLHERFTLDPATTGFATGLALLAGGLAAVAAQTRLARVRSGATLLARLGVGLAALGTAGLAVPAGVGGVLASVVVAGVGVGFALCGIARAAQTVVRDRSRTQMLMGGATVLGVVVGAPVGALLLGVDAVAPLAVLGAALVCALALTVAHPSFRAAAPPSPQPAMIGTRDASDGRQVDDTPAST